MIRMRQNQFLLRAVLLRLAMGFLLIAIGCSVQVVDAETISHLSIQNDRVENYLKMHPNIMQAAKAFQQRVILQCEAMRQLSKKSLVNKIDAIKPKQAILVNIFPIRSDQLSPGDVAWRRIHVALPQPIFLVGDDVRSKAWLLRDQLFLDKIHAVGFVVNIASSKAFQNLQDRFPHLKLVPMPGNMVHEWLHIQHYPVLITDHSISQIVK